jgi:hypothetical protein
MTSRRTVLKAFAGGAVALSLAAPGQAQTLPSWREGPTIERATDVGRLSDGRRLVMGPGRLYTADDRDKVEGYAHEDGGFLGPDAELYFVVAGLGSGFPTDHVYILDLQQPTSVVELDARGRHVRRTVLEQPDFLSGIALDNQDTFGGQLLVSGSRGDRNFIFGIDRAGAVSVITDQAPKLEGGLAVAPKSFGRCAGALIGPDELTDQIWAVWPDGRSELVLQPGLPAGGDVGVEALGFVPSGFVQSGGTAYVADRGSPGNPFPGTDSLLWLPASELGAQGVDDGDLLVATEGGGTTAAIRPDGSGYRSWVVANGPREGTVGHLEGHILCVSRAARLPVQPLI